MCSFKYRNVVSGSEWWVVLVVEDSLLDIWQPEAIL